MERFAASRDWATKGLLAALLTILSAAVVSAEPTSGPDAGAGKATADGVQRQGPFAHVTEHQEGDPAAGTVITGDNLEQYSKFIGPALQWAIGRGMRMSVVDPIPIPLEPKRLEATEKYSAQVRLSDDKLEIRNYVAGLPFPMTDANDPDAAVKLMYNFENRIAVDDLDVRNFDCDTGSILSKGPMHVERHFVMGHFRRLYYVGRLYHEPIHTWKTPDNLRYKEALFPLIEPFDLKGVGLTYNRYQDPHRQDDSWLYYPLLRRARRLSTAQRSEALFGQDTDIDSYGGYAGNIAWMDWKLLGKKRILGSMHSRHFPGKWSAPPADFVFDDDWEMREVYVLEGRSRLAGYAYSKRVIYLDRHSFVIPYTELYDQSGELWKAWINQWKIGRKPFPEAKTATYDYEQQFLPAISMFDLQLDHATRCTIPSREYPGEEAWYVNFGPEIGTNEDNVGLSAIISSGR
jgi:hypothetical protein